MGKYVLPPCAQSAWPISSTRMRAGNWSSRVDLPVSRWLRTGCCSHPRVSVTSSLPDAVELLFTVVHSVWVR